MGIMRMTRYFLRRLRTRLVKTPSESKSIRPGSRCRSRSQASRLFLPVLALLLNACATSPQSLPNSVLGNIHSVGIVSILGDDVHSYAMHMAAIINRGTSYFLPQWTMDDYARDVLRQSLNPRLHSVMLQSQARNLKRPAFDAEGSPKLTDLIPLLRPLVMESPVDAVLVISPASSRDPINATSVWLAGYGLYRLFSPGGTSTFEADMFVNVTLTLLDGATLQPLASASEFDFRRSFDDEWKQQLDNMPVRQREELEGKLKELLAKALRSLVHDEGLN